MALSQIQAQLQGIYELEMDHCITDYLITSRAGLDRCYQQALKSSESLLVCQDKDVLRLSVYLEDRVLENLKTKGTGIDLHKGNINDFCLALEGISHFVYLVWNAMFERSVTRLEMELQAEIDKFIVLSGCIGNSGNCVIPGQLRQLLFESVKYHDALSDQEVQRYRDANFYAEKYCWFLESRNFLNGGLQQGLLKELRRFYRLNQNDKIRRINCSY